MDVTARLNAFKTSPIFAKLTEPETMGLTIAAKKQLEKRVGVAAHEVLTDVSLMIAKLDERATEAIEMGTGDDPESDHIFADEILCETLKELGLVKTVEAFEAVHKWYA